MSVKFFIIQDQSSAARWYELRDCEEGFCLYMADAESCQVFESVDWPGHWRRSTEFWNRAGLEIAAKEIVFSTEDPEELLEYIQENANHIIEEVLEALL